MCPPVDFKCKKVRGERNLDWVKLDSGNSFQGDLFKIKDLSNHPNLKIVALNATASHRVPCSQEEL